MFQLHLLQLFAVFTASFVTPFASAAPQLSQTALPSDTDYAAYIAGTLSLAHFSTDPTASMSGVVAALTSDELQIFLISPRVCISGSDTPAYRVYLRNVSIVPVQNITVRFSYPAGTAFVVAQPAPIREVAAEGFVEWFIPVLAPGGSTDMTAQIENIGGLTSVTTTALAEFEVVATQPGVPPTKKTVATSHTIDGPCGLYNGPFSSLPPKQPAILCDANEAGCQNTFNQLPLGPRYNTATNTPTQLGPRFAEAIADIQPGECRVLEDSIVQEPAFHDAFNRQSADAAPFMVPLFNSGRDFSKLVHENELLGIGNRLKAKDTMKKIQRTFAEKVRNGVSGVLSGHIQTGTVRSQIDQWVQQAKTDWTNAQPGLRAAYAQLQTQRKDKFTPIATVAVNNAKQSITQACVSNTSDGGLAGLLPAVKQAYETALNERLQAYDTTQSNFLAFAGVSQIYLPSTWKTELLAALDAFDQGNRKPLEEFLRNRPLTELSSFPAFNQLWEATYGQHAKDDIARDNLVRLTRWEVALDTPKRVATACEKELHYGASIETTWCESGNAAQIILKGAPEPAKELDSTAPPDPVKEDIRPPQPINGPLNAILNQPLTNESCGPGLFPVPQIARQGDPYWADDCSCSCNQLVPGINIGNIEFCQSNELKPITRHDVYVTSPLECLTFELERHRDPFF